MISEPRFSQRPTALVPQVQLDPVQGSSKLMGQCIQGYRWCNSQGYRCSLVQSAPAWAKARMAHHHHQSGVHRNKFGNEGYFWVRVTPLGHRTILELSRIQCGNDANSAPPTPSVVRNGGSKLPNIEVKLRKGPAASRRKFSKGKLTTQLRSHRPSPQLSLSSLKRSAGVGIDAVASCSRYSSHAMHHCFYIVWHRFKWFN